MGKNSVVGNRRDNKTVFEGAEKFASLFVWGK